MNGLIDFDSIDDWRASLAAALSPYVPERVMQLMSCTRLDYVEDARDLFLNSVNRSVVVDATLMWIRQNVVAAYHGTRLTDDELSSVRDCGLVPLRTDARRGRIERALSAHPRWPEVQARLDDVLRDYGQGDCAGHREGQVHLTLSRSGLTNGFDHYLTHGAEVDQHIAHELLGKDGMGLLQKDGKPRVLKIAVPGVAALDAAHPYFSVESMSARGDLPNLVREFLNAWSFRLSRADFHPRTLKVDCGMVFHSEIPLDWILGIETLEE